MGMLEEDFVRRLYASVLDLIELPCLSKYLAAYESAFNPPRAVTFSEIEAALRFDDHAVTLSQEELASVDNLINQFKTMQHAYGHPFRRILSGWGRWWSH